MIKLLKYDWKRNSDGILSTFAILIIVQAVLTILGLTRNWDEIVLVSLSVFIYSLTGILLFINCCRTIDHNIKSYSRRLLTLHPLNGVGAVIILSWFVMMAVVVIAAIHLWIYAAYSDWDTSLLKQSELWNIGSIMGIVLQTVWGYTGILVAILLSITVARSFRVKGSTWIGILFFIILQSVYSWLEHLLFNNNEVSLGIISMDITDSNDASLSFFSNMNIKFLIGPFLMELVFFIGYLYLMSYLLNKKVEI